MFSQIVQSPRAVRITWIAWGLLLLAALVVLSVPKERRLANAAYLRGARQWIAGLDLYDEGGHGFIYLPPSAVLYVPFALLPQFPQEILWRTVTIGIFAVGIHRFCRMGRAETGIEFFPLVSALVLPKTWTCAINGQATPALAGLSLLALAELRERKWYRAAILLTAALAFKPLAVVLVLLVGALFRPTRTWLALTIAGLFAAPYLTQSPGYVTEQYVASIDMLDQAAEIGREMRWAHLFSLGRLVGIDLSSTAQTALRIVAALATLAVCLRECRYRPGTATAGEPLADWTWSLTFVYALATTYLLLFNPRTENNSYLMLSPAISILCARAQFIERRPVKAVWLGGAAIAIFAGHEFCNLVTPQVDVIWVCPLVALLFAAHLIGEAVLGDQPSVNPARSAKSAKRSRLAESAADRS